MRRTVLLALAAAMPLSTIAVPRAAHAAEPRSAACSATSVVSVMGVHAPTTPQCSLPILACPAESAGCVFTSKMSMTAAAGLGASRGLLRITHVDTGQRSDFYCGGPATACHSITPSAFLPAGTRLRVACSATKDNVLVNTKVNCAAAFEPLGE